MMSDIQLPSEWRETTLECVGVVVTGKTPSKKNPDFFSGTIPFIKPGDVNDQGVITHTEEHLTDLGAATVPTIPLGAVVVTCIGNLGRCAITSELSATNQQINSVIPDSGVNVSFIYYQLRTLKEWMLSESSATTVTIINKSKFSQAPIVLPPLAEQKVIADKLDTLLAQVETTKARLERIPEILKIFRQSVLSAAVSGKLTAISNQAYENVLVEQLAKPQKYSLGIGPFGSNLKVSDYREMGHPLVFVREIRANQFGDELTKFVTTEKFDELKAHRVLPGDILITKMGDPPGDVAIYPSDRPEAVITADCIKLSVNTKEYLRDYIAFAMRSDKFRLAVASISAGVAQQKVNLTKFRKLTLPVPPFEKQTEIVQRVEELFAFADSVEQKATGALARVNNLTQSILAKAFRGELTAEWRAANPDLISGDNSAAALLEKIKAERAVLAPSKKSRASKKS